MSCYQLPGELKETVELTADEGAGIRWDADEFVTKVAAREGCSPEQAREHVRAIFAALRDAVTPGEFDDITSQLDRSYRGSSCPTAPPWAVRASTPAPSDHAPSASNRRRAARPRNGRPGCRPRGLTHPAGLQSPTSSSNRASGPRAMTITGQAASAVTCRVTPPRRVAGCGP